MDIDSIFSPGGELDSILPSYSFRSGQLEMAQLVEKAISEGRHLVIEAGTGIGKSFAYLIPIFLQAMLDESSAYIISTSTITLEKQLYDKDIPLIRKALGSDIETAILFGRSNYLCIRRWEEARLEKKALGIGRGKAEEDFDAWAENTETGASAEISDERVSRLFPALASDEKDCPSFRCPFYSQCYFYSARKKAQKARIVVTNHHLLLLDAKNRAESDKGFDEDAVLPSYQVAVIDEAHHIEKEATDILSLSYSSESVGRYLDYLTRKEKRFGSASILDFLSPEEKDRGTGARIRESVAHIRTLMQQYDLLLEEVFSGRGNEFLLTDGFYRENRARLREGEAISEELRRIQTEAYTGYRENPSEENTVYFELLMRYLSNLSSYADILLDFIRFSDWDNKIPYARANGDKWEIRISPMDTGPVLNRLLVSNLSSVIYSSATLTVASSFDYFILRSGLEEEKGRLLSASFASPFEYNRNLMLLVPCNGISFARANTGSYTEYAANIIRNAILSSGGGALVLFTSKDMMRSVYAAVKDDIEDLMIQDDRSSRAALLSAFRKNRDSSLFAVSSFWEGIDAPGDTLRLVIIVKLPFAVPSTPIEAARAMHLEKNGGKPFMEIALPEATLRLKQGLGRLIRSEDDKGVVLILDTRIISTYYGRIMLSSLPECYFPDDAMLENIPDKIERFLF